MQIYRRGSSKFFKKIRKKCYTFYFFKHIIYVSGKSERTVPVGLAKAWIVVSGYLHMWRESFYAGVCRTPPLVEAQQEKHRLKETWKIKSYFGTFVSVTSFLYNRYLQRKKLPEYAAYAAEMVRYNFTLAVTRNTKKIAANEPGYYRFWFGYSIIENIKLPANLSGRAYRQVRVYAGKNNYILPNRILAKISFPVLMQDTHKNEKPEFRLWHACHIISGYFFDESNTEQIIFTA